MSWQGYVETLMATKSLTACGIFGHDGSVWATSQGFPMTAESIRQVVSSTLDSSKAASGVTVGNERYILVRGDPGVSVVLKKGQSGIVACRSAQCCIIALHDQTIKSEIALTHVGKIIDYLTKHGY